MSDNQPTTPGPQLRALNAMRVLIKAAANARSLTRSHETASQRIALDAALDIADREEREARRALIGGSHFGADAR